MSRNAGDCSVQDCDRGAFARGWCQAHYSRWRTTGDVQADEPIKTRRSPRYRDELPDGYWSDVSVLRPGFFGCVIVCETCADQLGPVFTPASAAMAIHGHQLRAHAPTGRHTGSDE